MVDRNRIATINGLKIAFENFQKTGIIKALEPCQWNYFDLLKDEGLLDVIDEDVKKAEDRLLQKLRTKQMYREKYYQDVRIADVLSGVIPLPEVDVSRYAKQIALLRYFKSIEELEL